MDIQGATFVGPLSSYFSGGQFNELRSLGTEQIGTGFRGEQRFVIPSKKKHSCSCLNTAVIVREDLAAESARDAPPGGPFVMASASLP